MPNRLVGVEESGGWYSDCLGRSLLPQSYSDTHKIGGGTERDDILKIAEDIKRERTQLLDEALAALRSGTEDGEIEG